MATSKPNRKFIYIEDNNDGTSTVTMSLPDEDVFSVAVLAFNFDEMFAMVRQDMPTEIGETITSLITIVPDCPEDV